jgi:glucose/arabinose dehydrogenase
MNSKSTLACAAVLALSTAAVSVHAAAAVALQPVTDGLVSPLHVLTRPNSGGELLVGDQVGIVYRLQKDGTRAATPFLDLREKLTELRTNKFEERGLLGLAFHPKHAANGKLYLYYSAPRRESAPKDWDHTSHVSEFKVKAGGAEVDLASERVLLQIDEPQFNHNGGRIAFGPDGLLYIGVGDGGNANDEGLGHVPEGNGQNKETLLGKILRIDVDRRGNGLEYGIPNDNPFAKGGGRAEIYAWGIRNPWGLSFDRGGKRQLFVSDVGQTRWEEINIIEKGGNYGWRIREGFHGFDPKNPIKTPEDAPTVAADGSPLRDPILNYMNLKGHPSETGLKGTSVTGGYVYRGKALPQLQGKYIFGDWSKNWGVPDGIIFVATAPKSGKGEWALEAMQTEGIKGGQVKGYVTAFGEDDDGELYVMTSQKNALMNGTTGKVWKLAPAAGAE